MLTDGSSHLKSSIIRYRWSHMVTKSKFVRAIVRSSFATSFDVFVVVRQMHSSIFLLLNGGSCYSIPSEQRGYLASV